MTRLRYDAASYERLADTYDATRGLLPDEAAERFADRLLHLAVAKAETTFVEPGVGTGRIALPIVRRGYSYTGVDTSDKMLRAFGRKLRDVPNRLALVCADATLLPFGDASFDVAVTASVLYLIPGWQRALAEIRRVLRPDGLYLYCVEEVQANDVAEACDRQWRAIVSRHGFQHVWYSNVTNNACLHLLKEQGASIERVTAAEWTAERALPDYLAAYPIKIRPLYWQIPDDVFSVALHEFDSWARGTFQLEDEVLAYDFTLKIHAARKWGGARSEAGRVSETR